MKRATYQGFQPTDQLNPINSLIKILLRTPFFEVCKVFVENSTQQYSDEQTGVSNIDYFLYDILDQQQRKN